MKTLTCDRCCGTGNLPHYRHVEAGRCFACQGSGKGAGKDVAVASRPTVAQKILTSDRYPGWKITAVGGASYNMRKDDYHIVVTQQDGKTWQAWVVEPDMTSLFSGTAIECVAWCEAQ